MIDMREIVNRAISHQAVIESSKRDVRDNLIRIDEENKKLETLLHEHDVTKFSHKYLDTLVKEESGKFIKSLNDMLNFAVRSIFNDRDYSIEIRVEENKATIRLKYTDDEGNKIDADIKDCGGGIKSVIGMLMQIHTLYKYRAEPILFLDESLSQISAEYLGNMLGLLNELATKNGLKILLITHDNRFIDHESIINRYEVKDGLAKKVITQ